MTEPGPTPKVPIKVVPIYFDVPATVPVDTAQPEDAPHAQPREKTASLGTAAVVLAVVAGILQGVGIGVATAGDFSQATIFAYLAIAIAVVALGAGVAAIVLDRGRRLGIIATILAIFANPYLLLGMLRLFCSLTT
ncbi:MAG: hypothetical protein Q8M65_02625 [Rhodoglobus sp.]|nr:hypothetical protein [Rhodoglobus sp.]